ncbi:MAG: hypothetical protein FJ147_22565 [Deltaproteobacteria bacterium]|nr:hypothetical protein [Deltaproteobacteria bacterium]
MQTEEHKTRRQRKGTERVKAWIYSVMNPLMEDLLAENKLLAKQDITWRYQTTEMEFIRETRGRVSPLARPNYDDLLRGLPSLKQEMKRRDEKIGVLFKSASQCWKDLIGHFHHQVESPLTQWRAEGNPYPGGGTPEKEFSLLIAEHVINNVEELPAYYTSRPFWTRFRDFFLSFRSVPSFSQLNQAISELKKANETLIEILDQTRSQLCEEYDIPAAPIS